MDKDEKDQLAMLMKKLEDGAILDQPCWSFIKEMNSFSEERLESVAIRDGYRAYTYRQMFRNWQRYAEAFTGVGITGENGSRAALISTPSAESIFAIYGLNMTGATVSQIYHLDLYDEKQINSMIEREGITDLIISEIWAFPLLMKRLLNDREELGLRNIIVLESPMGGEFVIPWLEAMRKTNAAMFGELEGGLLMEELLKEYEAKPILSGDMKSSDSSFILHTTGTVNGMHKPVPLSDKNLNAFIPVALKAKETYDDFQGLPDHLVCGLTLNTAWVYAMVDMLHMPLGLGMEVVCIPWGGTNPRYGEAIEYYGFNIMFTSMSILDSWLKSLPDMDLSSVKVVFMGGTYVSPEYKQQFNDYLNSCGSTARIVNGYGLSELGGACIISPSDRDDDAIGFPLPGFKVKIYVEDEERFYELSDGPRTGVLYISSDTLSSGKLDDETFFELEELDGVKYLNTNDLVRVNDDGSMTCIGRSNQYFVNNAGIRFDAGLIQTAVTSQPGIVACGIVPEFHKMIHDNVPVLYVETDKQGPAELATIHQALVQVFVKDGMLVDSNMPSMCVVVERVPLNSGGKVDGKRLASGTVTGNRFSVKSVKAADGKLVDVLLVPASEGESDFMGAGVPEELENDPYNILSELFAIIPDINEGNYAKVFRIPGLRELILKLTGFDINNVFKSTMRAMPKMFNMAFKKYVLPITKGEKKMSKKDKKKAGFPMFPMPDPSDWDWDWDFDWGWDMSDFKSFWGKGIDQQKSSKDAAKDQFEQFFDFFQDTMDDFVEFLPEELPWAPSWAKPPKEVRKAVKEWEKMANDFFVEQADLVTDFVIKSQEKACEQLPEAKEDEKKEPVKVKAEVVKETKTAKTTKTTKTTAAKSTAAKSAAKPAAAKPAATKTAAAKPAAAKDAKQSK